MLRVVRLSHGSSRFKSLIPGIFSLLGWQIRIHETDWRDLFGNVALMQNPDVQPLAVISAQNSVWAVSREERIFARRA